MSSAAIDEELADLAVDLVLLSQELINTKLKLQTLSKAGWVEMAKARYIMGPSSVSVLQLPTVDQEKPICASATVERNECVRSGGNVRHNYFSLLSPTVTPQELPDGVRLRKPDTGSAVQEVAVEKKKTEDPIRWFGFMPPLPLKQTQKHFNVGIETVVEIANIQSEMRG